MDTTAGGGQAPGASGGPEHKEGPGFGEKLMEGAGEVGSKILGGAKKAAVASGEAISGAVERYAPAAHDVASGIARETKIAFSKGIKPVTVALIGAGLCILWMILPLVLGIPLHLQVIAQKVDTQSSQSIEVPELPVNPTATPPSQSSNAVQIVDVQFTPRGEGNNPPRAAETPPAAQTPATPAPAPTPAVPAPGTAAAPPAQAGGSTEINLKGSDMERKVTYQGVLYEADFRPAKLKDDTKALAIGAIVLGGPIFGTGAAMTAGTRASVENASQIASTTSATLGAKNSFVVGLFFFIILAVLFIICELVIKDYYGMEKVFAGVAIVWLVYCYTFGWIAQTMMVAFAKRAGGITADVSGNAGALADAPMRILLAGIVILIVTWLVRKAMRVKQPI